MLDQLKKGYKSWKTEEKWIVAGAESSLVNASNFNGSGRGDPSTQDLQNTDLEFAVWQTKPVIQDTKKKGPCKVWNEEIKLFTLRPQNAETGRTNAWCVVYIGTEPVPMTIPLGERRNEKQRWRTTKRGSVKTRALKTRNRSRHNRETRGQRRRRGKLVSRCGWILTHAVDDETARASCCSRWMAATAPTESRSRSGKKKNCEKVLWIHVAKRHQRTNWFRT